jgi:imidazolonepropionase-like amidohydrolase
MAYNEIVITNINIVDVENNNIKPNSTIFIKSGKITKIISNFIYNKNNKNINLYDGANKFIIPGLFDSHV